MRQLAYQGRFDMALSLATSLAFYDDATNRDIFARIHEALRPGGVFFFDQSNMFYWMKRTMPERYAFDAGTCVLSGRHVKNTPDGQIESGWDLRLYHLAELKLLLGTIGFAFVMSFRRPRRQRVRCRQQAAGDHLAENVSTKKHTGV